MCLSRPAQGFTWTKGFWSFEKWKFFLILFCKIMTCAQKILYCSCNFILINFNFIHYLLYMKYIGYSKYILLVILMYFKYSCDCRTSTCNRGYLHWVKDLNTSFIAAFVLYKNIQKHFNNRLVSFSEKCGQPRVWYWDCMGATGQAVKVGKGATWKII